MKTISLHNHSLSLPTSWEELSFNDKCQAFDLMERAISGNLASNPVYALVLFLCHLTGYKPSRSFNSDRDTINFNLLRIAEQLTVPFSIVNGVITPNLDFHTNPFPFIKIKGKRYIGVQFNLDVTARTNFTARQFTDAFDLLSAVRNLPLIEQKNVCINQLISILYPAHPDYHTNATSDHINRVNSLPSSIKYGIVSWFASIVKFYTTHPDYSPLFRGHLNHEEDPPSRNGMNEVSLFLRSEGYGDPYTMNLTDYFDAQIKSLRDSISRSISSGVKPDELSAKTGIPMSVILSLSN
ncbi:hypothetical protein MASR1M31_04460 [Porphyromonadaceae bacterium]